jgi:hypothetical protein
LCRKKRPEGLDVATLYIYTSTYIAGRIRGFAGSGTHPGGDV